ncbi:MAG TPA: AsmA family protein [Gemmatimonadales bacterium]|nr:AsmA family protein [Gemmatimonadales bacterium]
MRFARYAVLGLVAAVVLVAGLLYGGLRALGSEVGRARIASMLSDKLGQPVSIGGIDLAFAPSPSLTATEISVGGADSNAAPGLAVRSVRVVPQLSSLMPGRTPLVNRVEINGLRVSLRKDSTGKWHLPGAAAAPAAAADTSRGGPAVEVTSLAVRNGQIRVVDDSLRTEAGGPTITTINDVEADLKARAGRLAAPRFTGRLGRTVVTGAAAMGPEGARLRVSSPSLDNTDLSSLFALAALPANPMLRIQGKAPFELSTTISRDFRTFVASGRAAVERVSLGTIVLEKLQTPFRYEKGILALDSLAFGLYGGRQRGAVSIDFSHDVPQYTIRTAVTGLDVNRALSATTTMKDVLGGSGTVSGTVTGSGSTADAIEQSLRGTLAFKVENGVLRNYPILANVNQVVGITAGDSKDTRFERLSGTATIGGGRARIQDLMLRAGELTVGGQGVVTFERSVDFRLRAVVTGEKSTQIAQRVGAAEALRNREGAIEIPLTVTGSATAPRTSVDAGAFAKKRVKEQLESGFLKLLKKSKD